MARSAALLFLPAAVVSYNNPDPANYNQIDVNPGVEGKSEGRSNNLKWDFAQFILMKAHWVATQHGTEQSVCVQDDGGHLKGFLRQDHSWPLGGDIACKKARTSALFKSRSGVVGSLSGPGGSLWRVETSNGGLVTNEGGVQFTCHHSECKDLAREGSGAVGVAGGTSAQDYTVANESAYLSPWSSDHRYHRPKGPLYDGKLADVADLTSRWEISAGQAMAVVDTVIAASRDKGVHVDVAVVDHFGNLKAFAREEGTWYGASDIAVSKARAAVAFMQNTTSLSSHTQPGADLFALEVTLRDFGVTSLGGGVLLRYKGQVIGAVGVSGSTQAEDAILAEAGAQAVGAVNPIPIYHGQMQASLRMVQNALKSAIGLSQKVSAATVDRGGNIGTVMTMDGGAPGNAELAMIKARTAAGLSQDTNVLSGLFNLNGLAGSTGDLASIQYSNGGLLAIPGALIGESSGNVWGAIGVHGAQNFLGPGGADALLALAGKSGFSAYVETVPNQGLFSVPTGDNYYATNDASLDQAQYILKRAQELSTAPFALAVVDRAGRVKLAHRQEGATFGDLELAIRKARTSALMNGATGELKTQPMEAQYMLEANGMTAIKGGARLQAFGERSDQGALIGGVGVHGSGSADSDHSLAHRASNDGSHGRPAQSIIDIELAFARSKAYTVKAGRVIGGDFLSTAVADETGRLKFFMRGDNSPLGHAGLAMEKARSAVLSDGTTQALGDSTQPPSNLYLLELPLGLTGIGGGAVLKTTPPGEPTSVNVRYGAIGVSSSNNALDVADAAAASAFAYGGAAYTETVSAQGSQPSEAGLYGVTDVSLDQAVKVIDAALANATLNNEKVSVSVVDRYGNLKMFASSDRATGGSVDLSIQKARTSRYFDQSTQQLHAATAPSQSLYMLEVAEKGLTTIPGGTEFRYTDPARPDLSGTSSHVIGAIGVAGSSSLVYDLKAMAAGAAAIGSDFATGHYDMSVGRAQYLVRQGMKAAGSSPVSISILDNGGKLRAFSRHDNASGASVDISIKRGRSTILFGADSLSLQARSQTYTAPAPTNELYGLEWSNGGLQTGAGGSLLQAANGVTYGSIGVAGTIPKKETSIATTVAGATAAKDWGFDYQFQNTNKTSYHIDEIGSIDLDTAWAAIEGALKKAQLMHVKMNYAVVDKFGILKAFLRDDNAFIGSIDIAIKKAKTSALFGIKSSDLGTQSRAGQALWRVETTNDGLVSFEGGFPIRVCNQVIGAIGVSGDAVGIDRQVALAGAEAASSMCDEVEAAPARNAGALAAAVVAVAAFAFF